MKRVAAFALLALAAGCAPRAEETIRVHVRHESDRCTILVEGRVLPLDPDRTDFRHWRGREIGITGDVNTPYRCLGGLIYALQRSGVERIGFISEPAPRKGTSHEQ